MTERIPETTHSLIPEKLAVQIANISLQNASMRRKQSYVKQQRKLHLNKLT